MAENEPLHELRAAMDVVNRRLVDVLHDRARLCRAIGAWKRSHATAPVDATREQQMLAALLQHLPTDGFDAPTLTAILREVFTASRALVERTTRGS